jgi:hypothetical protein
MNFQESDKERYEYSKNKIPELQLRFNENQKAEVIISDKISRHQSIIDNYEMKGSE